MDFCNKEKSLQYILNLIFNSNFFGLIVWKNVLNKNKQNALSEKVIIIFVEKH